MTFKENKWGFCFCLPPYRVRRRGTQVFGLTLCISRAQTGVFSKALSNPFARVTNLHCHCWSWVLCSLPGMLFFSPLFHKLRQMEGYTQSIPLAWCEGAGLQSFTITFMGSGVPRPSALAMDRARGHQAPLPGHGCVMALRGEGCTPGPGSFLALSSDLLTRCIGWLRSPLQKPLGYSIYEAALACCMLCTWHGSGRARCS